MRIRDLMQGKCPDAPPKTDFFAWVGVRDLAEAHALGLEVPETGGKRFLVTEGLYSNKLIADAIRETHPEYASKLPPTTADDDLRADNWQVDNSRTKEVLGLKYRPLKECIGDAVTCFKKIQAGG